MALFDKHVNSLPDQQEGTSPLPKPLAKPKTRRGSDRHFEQALYAYHRGDYFASMREFEKSCEASAASRNYSRYVESCTYVLRILAEREEFAKIDRIEKRILDILSSADASDLTPRLKSRALYVLGICSCYQETRHEQAMRRFREAIDFAMLGDDKEAFAAPLYGAATVLYARARYSDALKELDRLGVLMTCLNLPDISTASLHLRAQVLRNQGHLDEALAAAWKAFESLKHHPHLVLYLHTLCVLGTIYLKKGDASSARLYLDLADRGLKRDEFPRAARLVDDALAALSTMSNQTDADLIFDTRTGLLIEKNKGEIRFEGQFILRDLLRVFLENPGMILTKEDLVKRVWREGYNPKVHDNKIYVTIKRLRQLLETGDGKTEYILRAKTGYFLNPKAHVRINDQNLASASEKSLDGKPEKKK